MSKADEMFEKLGYEYINELENSKSYLDNDEENEISFTDYKDIGKVIEIDKFCGHITLQELQAINEKVKELGWNE